MSLFDNLINAVSAGFGDANSTQSKLAQAVLKRFQTNDGGGLAEIVQQLHSKGLGEVVQSWIGTGSNLPISPEQLKAALGSDWVQQLATRVGVSPEVLTSHLSEILPKIVDRLTPNGKLPEASNAS